MTDPLDVLRALDRAPELDTTPDPAFAAALRARLVRALLPAAPFSPGGPMTLSPYLAVPDARAAMTFYTEAFGAVTRGQPYLMEDGRIGHAEVSVGGAVLMLSDEYPEMDIVGPLRRGGTSVSLHLTIPDVDAVVARAVAAGATVEREPTDAPYGRTGVVVDPAGHRWMVQTPPTGAAVVSEDAEAAGSSARHGDVGYQSLYVPDVERTKAFFAAVLGWAYRGGRSEGGWEAQGVTPMTGLMGGAERPEVQLCFRVDDVGAAVQHVRQAGGTAQEPQDKPYGRLAECRDDQGLRFQLWQPR